ncbi:MAG: hypothetical protein GX163_04085 [Bacteroidetes bacterium]|nr:hypothetical protein [Bacteroidota bacterium]
MGVDLAPENPRDKPLIAAYTYSADGERAVRYLPGRLDAYYSAKDAGSTDRLESILYPNPLVTVKTLPIPEGVTLEELARMPLTKYTKHYYIGSERVASALGTVNDLGLLCEQSGIPEPEVIDRMNQKVMYAEEYLRIIYDAFGKDLVLGQPLFYGREVEFICGDHDYTKYAPFWYHPDHLGSSSYITNLGGEINQHLEYLPFGELLVEEHLNSYNSPYKFNAKEFDAETGNYYYHSRYYDPKWSLFLGVDEHYFNYPSFSLYVYTFHNPINFIDPDGRDGIRIIDKKNKTITIKAVYYVQTEARQTRAGKIKGYTPKQIAKMEQRTNKWLNKQNLSVTEGDYDGYSIQFDLSFKEGGNTMDIEIKANNENFEGHSIGNSMQKGNSNSDPQNFSLNADGDPVGGVTQNNKYVMMNTEHDNQSNQIHEFGHTLGLDHPEGGAKDGLMRYPPSKISQEEANKLGNSDFLPAIQKPQE